MPYLSNALSKSEQLTYAMPQGCMTGHTCPPPSSCLQPEWGRKSMERCGGGSVHLFHWTTQQIPGPRILTFDTYTDKCGGSSIYSTSIHSSSPKGDVDSEGVCDSWSEDRRSQRNLSLSGNFEVSWITYKCSIWKQPQHMHKERDTVWCSRYWWKNIISYNMVKSMSLLYGSRE